MPEKEKVLTDFNKIVGERVKLYRSAKGYTQEELAYHAGIHTSHLSKIERGTVNCTLSSLERILAALDVPSAEFFQFDSLPEPEQNPIIAKTVASMNNLVLQEQECIYNVAHLFEQQKKTK